MHKPSHNTDLVICNWTTRKDAEGIWSQGWRGIFPDGKKKHGKSCHLVYHKSESSGWDNLGGTFLSQITFIENINIIFILINFAVRTSFRH